ncbi:LysR family transcriptional regulator [Methylobacterium sp. J-077]|uniref:LysR family transcriptional regulator n=1 Tax=Methylobacterium sp. J-077 TaxID=2836656 RepID=UPI001FB8A46F|nr:LysR family transcriptional regulator [Methylobacterium sp. J-077]MCJ2127180.1 LysR family transcriptional regulator [Methylobacterium sp. J-077]
MPTLKQLEALKWIVLLGSYERAADRLNTSQSAISKRIQELESELGISVFERTRRGSKLTIKGEIILELGEEMLRMRDRIEAVSSNEATPIRQLKFGVTELTALIWLPQFVGELRANYLDIQLEPEVEQGGSLFEKLKNGSMDFIIAPDMFAKPGYRKVPLASVKSAWMCSPALFRGRGIVRLADLSQFNILTQGDQSGSGLVFERWLQECGLALPRPIKSNSLVALVGLTISEVGISYLPERCFDGFIERDMLHVIDTDPALPSVVYAVIFRGEHSTDIREAICRIARSSCDFTKPVMMSAF